MKFVMKLGAAVWLLGAVVTWLFFTTVDREPSGKWGFGRDWEAKFFMALSWFATFWQWNWPQLRQDLRK